MKRREARGDVTLRIRSAELSLTPPPRVAADEFVARLGSGGLGCTSYVVARREGTAPEWIVLDYAAEGRERVWRQVPSHADDVLSYVLVEDDSSSGYVTIA
ncbi:hypothetical protein [Microbacterium oxydans]|uniref:hypothetical protein n=1 Tax=Microbacterium oxydans TaxID=82380 RepID=UPI00226B4993|nr:hypothetical protein [Microbacterium oxydans]WAA66226.1 hypothetical protein MME74_00355 [Microbacterium oxydans]